MRQSQVTRHEAKEFVNEYVDILEKNQFIVYRRSKLLKVNPPTPDYFILELTNKCNLNCIHCSVSANESHGKDLTKNEWMHVIDSITQLDVRAVGLSGGEPLLRKDFWDIAAYAYTKGLLVGLVTNGLLIEARDIDLIKKYNIDVQVSLDGSNPRYHNMIRNCDLCFEQVIKKLQLLKENNISFTLAAVATAENYKDLPDLLQLAENLGAKSFRVQPFFPAGRGIIHRSRLDISPEITKYISSFLLEAAKTSQIEVGGFYFQFVLDPDPSTINQPCEDGSCSAGSGFAGITHDGYVYPCSHIWSLSQDNIREKSLPEVWLNSRLFNFFRSLKKIDSGISCQNCRFFSSCKGGCKAMNILDGDLSARDYHCWIAD
jgi:radical SAM protein with 4Fe4S-binding SPASM domain